MGRPVGSKNRPKIKFSPRSEALNLTRLILDQYEEDNSDVSYQSVLASLEFVRELSATLEAQNTE